MKRWFIALALTTTAVPASFIAAPYPQELILQHVPTIFGLLLLAVAICRFHPSVASLACSFAFLWLHIIGARWIYSFVPYDDWTQALFGMRLSDFFGWERNHYDRLVHFASGFLGLPILSDFLQSTCGLRPRGGSLLAAAVVLAIGAIYEVIEWQIAISFSPAMAKSYNGQQGDVWDAQKDLALALLGAMLCVPLVYSWTSQGARSGG